MDADRILRAQDEIDRLFALAFDAAPAGAEGTDSTGSVRVVLGADGVAERIDLQPGWRRTAGVDALGRAVAEAAESAASVTAAARKERLADGGFEAVARWVDGATDEPPPGVPDRPAEPVWPRSPRPHDVISRQMLALIDEVEAVPTRDTDAAGRGVGVAGFGKLSVRLVPGLHCTADAEWLSRRSDSEVAEALSGALAAARADLVAGAGASVLSALLAEMSALSAEMSASLRVRADLAGGGRP